MALSGLLCATVLLCTAKTVWGLELSPQDQRGKRVFTEGVSPSGGEIMAKVGMAGSSLPGHFMPCSNCHGPDGRGRPEGGVLPPDITWNNLTKPYGHIHPQGRTHPPFTEETAAEAIREGVDPGGNPLDPAMPRYTMGQSDMEDLIAYLKRAELDLDSGISPQAVRIGTLLPIEGPLASLGQTIRGMLEAYFEEVNAGGGVFGRRLELVVAEASGEPAERLKRFGELLQQDVFALVSPFVAGMEEEVARLAEEQGLPSIGPFTQLPESGYVVNRTTFYLFGGLREQARALVEYSAEHLPLANGRLGLVVSPGALYEGMVDVVTAQAEDHGWKVVVPPLGPHRFDLVEIASSLKDRGAEAVVIFGSQTDVQGFLGALPGLAWTPYVLMPGSQAGPGLLRADPRLSWRILLAYPSFPGGGSGAERAAFEELRARHGLGKGHTAAQVSAYASARLLVEGLKRSGKLLSRAKLVETLETLSDFAPGMTPPLSYHGNRRIGALGAWIVSVDLHNQTVQPLGWQALERSR